MTRRFLPLAAVVLVPVGALAPCSWRGMQAQRRTEWVEAMESAAQWAEVQVGRLSRQFPAANPRHLLTVRGTGYRLVL